MPALQNEVNGTGRKDLYIGLEYMSLTDNGMQEGAVWQPLLQAVEGVQVSNWVLQVS